MRENEQRFFSSQRKLAVNEIPKKKLLKNYFNSKTSQNYKKKYHTVDSQEDSPQALKTYIEILEYSILKNRLRRNMGNFLFYDYNLK